MSGVGDGWKFIAEATIREMVREDLRFIAQSAVIAKIVGGLRDLPPGDSP